MRGAQSRRTSVVCVGKGSILKGRQRRSGRRTPFGSQPRPPRSGGLKSTLRAVVVLIVLVGAIGGLAAYSIVRRGLSAHDHPSRVEELLARAMRRWATPSATRNRPNPVQPTEAVIDAALAHYADHCASCHANDGSGDTAIGRGLYPKAPDMRGGDTQSLTDGELFSIIEHGIRLTGMPAWGNGTPEGERESWGLVHFIRRLPKLTPEDIERMETLNPKSPAEFKEQEEIRRFLQGESAAPEEHKKEHKH
jgi:mono/diheme cytochrome c family protein